jgi:hypothetical protein
MLLGSGQMQRLDYVEIPFKQWTGRPKEPIDELDVISRLHELLTKEKK